MFITKTEGYQFSQRNDEEVQHLAFEVENVEKTLEQIKGKGIMLIDENPRFGAENSEFAFTHAQIHSTSSLVCTGENNLRGEENEQN
jgi:4-hydroxyphenylpyruvate dioxygenase-like putative hemolysin